MMPEMIVYLLKVNLALVLFYAGYHFILQRYTFHSVNRVYLIISLVYSAFYPLINLSEILNRNGQLKEKLNMLDWQEPVTYAISQTENSAGIYWQIALLIFWTGVIFMSLRLLVQLSSLLILHVQSRAFISGNIKFRKITKAVNPFSFWRTIYLNPECHDSSELRAILEHEQVHVKQLHTLDVMLAELSTIFYWFNPGVWLMKKAIKANLEFITDQEVIRSGVDSKEYQYILLKTQLLTQNQLPVNNFHFLTIKKRIAMINKKPSNRIKLSNYVLLMPAIMLMVLITGISKADFTGTGVVEAITHLPVLPLTQVFTNDSETRQRGIRSGVVTEPSTLTEEQKSLIMEPALDTIKKDSIKTYPVKTNGEAVKGTRKMPTPPTPPMAPEPLNVVDGIPMPRGAPKMNPNTILSVNVYHGEGSKGRYGEAGKNGVVEIRTKAPVAPLPPESPMPAKLIEELPNQNQNISLTNIDKQLIILDGKEITRSDLDLLKVSTIGAINILNGNAAVSSYGEKGINGVIIITTKQ